MPATPMKLAALRYSPEMALAFQPTLTLRPATKKSLAVLLRLADQKPIQIVTRTVRAQKVRIQGSRCIGWEDGKTRRRENGKSVRAFGENPLTRVVAHVDELAEDAVVFPVQFSAFRRGQVTAANGVFQPRLRFSAFALGLVQFVHEDSFVLSPTPRFGDLAGNRTGGTPNLVRQ